jgi:hypothetical protein
MKSPLVPLSGKSCRNLADPNELKSVRPAGGFIQTGLSDEFLAHNHRCVNIALPVFVK